MMKILMASLLIIMAGMDFPLHEIRLLMRGGIQLFCFMAAVVWWSGRLNGVRLKPYWWIGLYVVYLLATAPFSVDPVFVLFQVSSLCAVLLFAMAYTDQRIERKEPIDRSFMHMAGGVVTLAVLASVFVGIKGDASAFEYATGRYRLQGVFDEPATLAATAGLALGYALLSRIAWWAAGICVVAACYCLYGTGSRTYAVAIAAAFLVTGIFSGPRSRRFVLLSIVPSAVLAMAVSLFITVDSAGLRDYLRTESISSLTGRTAMWNDAVAQLSRKIVVGYGFTLGSLSVVSNGKSIAQLGGEGEHGLTASRFKLHSGYVQAVMDSGVVGGAIYIAIFLVAFARLLKSGRGGQHRFLMYSFVFLGVANGAETLIHAASVFRSTFGWIVIIMVMALPSVANSLPRAATASALGRTGILRNHSIMR